MSLNHNSLVCRSLGPGPDHALTGSWPRVEVVASINLATVRVADLPEAVAWLRLVGGAEHSPARARGYLPGRLMYACSEPGGAVRLDRLREAAGHCELVEL